MELPEKFFWILSAIVCEIGAKVVPQNYVKCGKNDKFLWPDYGDNTFYFECIGEDNFVKRPCPVKTVFNYYEQQCTWPEEWLEPPAFSKLVEPFQSLDFSPTCLESELHLFWSDPQVSRDFFRCSGIGQYERLSCPLGQTFIFMVQMCVYEQQETTTDRPLDRFPDCLDHELHITWPDPWYPQNFFICVGIGQFEIHGCPPANVFVFMLQMCVRDDELTTFPTFLTSSANLTSITTEGVKTSTSTPSTQETSMTSQSPTERSSITSMPEGLQTAPTTHFTISYPKLKCLVCWRPTCEGNELHLKWPDYDYSRNYFECIRQGVLILKSCRMHLVFDFKSQNCIPVKQYN